MHLQTFHKRLGDRQIDPRGMLHSIPSIPQYLFYLFLLDTRIKAFVRPPSVLCIARGASSRPPVVTIRRRGAVVRRRFARAV